MERASKKEPAAAANARQTQGSGSMTNATKQHAASIADLCFDIWVEEKNSANDAEAARILSSAVRAYAGGAVMLGLLGKCQIQGCDVHVLTMQQEVIRHLSVNSATPVGFSAARAYWQAPHDSAVAVLVYSDHSDIVLLDGTTVRLTGG